MIKSAGSHGDKLKALQRSKKLPDTDKAKVGEAIERYQKWLEQIAAVKGTVDQRIAAFVAYLNEYRLFIDLDLIFASQSNFLYRQKGQLKLDNSVIEEFLPIFLTNVLEEEFRGRGLSFGPARCFASIYFSSSIVSDARGGGINIRDKNQDFVISKPLYLQASHQPDFSDAVTKSTHIAYVAAECKTNLDKTMFQEAAATALDLKTSVPSAKYFLLCEWLDMIPMSSSVTAIDEIIILRKARRLPSETRQHFDTVEGRLKHRDEYELHLREHPFAIDVFSHFASHIRSLIENEVSDDVLDKGYF